jgi:hypothetical protein
MELRIPSSKKTKRDPDLLHMAEILQDFAAAAVHGEHLWLGVIYTNMIHHLQQQGLDFNLLSSKPCPRSNRWKQLVIKIISPLLTAAKAMWKIKEDSRREVLLGVPSAAEKIQLARQKKKHGDIRRWLKRVQHKVGHLQHVTETNHDIDSTPISDLLSATLPSPTRAHTRLRRTRTPQVPPLPHPAPTTRWRTTTIQDFFPLTKEHSKKMIAKNPPPTGQLPFLRRIRTEPMDLHIDLSWLPPKETEEKDDGRGGAEERIVLESSSSSSRSSSVFGIGGSSNSSSSSSSSRSSSSSGLYGVFSSIGRSNFIFRDSDSRSSLSNESVDDNTKRRGVG